MTGWNDFIGGLKDFGGVVGGVYDKIQSGPMHILDTGAGVITHTEDTLASTLSNVSSNLSLPLLVGGVVVLVIFMKK